MPSSANPSIKLRVCRSPPRKPRAKLTCAILIGVPTRYQNTIQRLYTRYHDVSASLFSEKQQRYADTCGLRSHSWHIRRSRRDALPTCRTVLDVGVISGRVLAVIPFTRLIAYLSGIR